MNILFYPLFRWPTFTVRKTTVLALFCSLVVFAYAATVSTYFAVPLSEMEDKGRGFAQLTIPDTFIYQSVVAVPDPIAAIFLSAVKNTIGPSLIWLLAGNNWIVVSAINAVLVLWTLLYVAKLGTHLNLPNRKIMLMVAMLGLLPTTLFHSVGALKEIPTLLCMTAFFYHYIRGEKRWIVFALLCVIFRYQIVLVLGAFWLFDKFGRRALPRLALCLLAFAAIYPLVKVGVFELELTAALREGNPGGIGGAVESVRDSIPGLSMFAVLIRLFQTFVEPLVLVMQDRSFYLDGDFSVLRFAFAIGFILMLPTWGRFIWRMFRLLRSRFRGSDDMRRLYLLLLAFIFPTAGFSVIHHRYLYPIFALLIIASQLKPKRINRVSAASLPHSPSR